MVLPPYISMMSPVVLAMHTVNVYLSSIYNNMYPGVFTHLLLGYALRPYGYTKNE